LRVFVFRGDGIFVISDVFVSSS